ncbi:MAG: hypothetical protein K2H45_02230, partial [Acetatifactor sp.]|nr:hypothetical protein [Acetatifactor sp.]
MPILISFLGKESNQGTVLIQLLQTDREKCNFPITVNPFEPCRLSILAQRGKYCAKLWKIDTIVFIWKGVRLTAVDRPSCEL